MAKAYGDQRKEEGYTRSGDFTIKKECGLSSWKTDFKHGTWLRLLPAMDEQGNPLPMRVSDTKWDYNDWIRAEYVAYNIGTDEKVCFNAVPADWDDMKAQFLERPYKTFRDRLYRMRTDKRYMAMLYPLFNMVGKDYPAAPKASLRGYVQAIVVNSGGKDYIADPKLRVLMSLPSTARKALEEVVEARDENGKPVYDDLTSLGGAKWLHFYNRDQQQNREQQAASVNYEAAMNRERSNDSGRGSETSAYAVSVEDTYNGAPAAVPDKVWKECWLPFDNVLNFLSTEDMVTIICSAFSPEVARLGFMGTPYEPLLPATVRSVTVDMGQPQPAQAPPEGEEPAEKAPWEQDAPAQPETEEQPASAPSREQYQDNRGGIFDTSGAPPEKPQPASESAGETSPTPLTPSKNEALDELNKAREAAAQQKPPE